MTLILLLTGHIEHREAAALVLLGLGAAARDLAKFAARRGQLRALTPLIHVTSRTLILASELMHPDKFIFSRIPLPHLTFGQTRGSQPTLPPDWPATLDAKPRGRCRSCGHEIVTDLPHCPACGATWNHS